MSDNNKSKQLECKPNESLPSTSATFKSDDDDNDNYGFWPAAAAIADHGARTAESALAKLAAMTRSIATTNSQQQARSSQPVCCNLFLSAHQIVVVVKCSYPSLSCCLDPCKQLLLVCEQTTTWYCIVCGANSFNCRLFGAGVKVFSSEQASERECIYITLVTDHGHGRLHVGHSVGQTLAELKSVRPWTLHSAKAKYHLHHLHRLLAATACGVILNKVAACVLVKKEVESE